MLENITSFILIFILVWWLVLFIVLPFGARPAQNTQLGFADSAPEHPKIGLKLYVTTIISLVITVLYILYLEPYFLDIVFASI